MTAAWIVQRPNEEPQAFDDADSAKRAVASLTQEQQRAACIFAVEVEPEVRGAAYWRRERAETGTTEANVARTDPSATDVVLGRNGTIQEGAA